MALFGRSGGVGVGIDLGTANVVVFQSDRGIVFDEPSCVAVRKLPRGGVEVIALFPEAAVLPTDFWERYGEQLRMHFRCTTPTDRMEEMPLLPTRSVISSAEGFIKKTAGLSN